MIALLIAAAAASLSPHQAHDHAPQLGKLSFDSSCAEDAQALFVRGLGWLHSFEYEEAARSFGAAAAADPRCGIAHWGVAMSHYHPLWAPPTEEELAKGRAAVERARTAGAGSKREQDYIDAIATFYRDSDRLDHKTRALAYSAAMERLHKSYPEDDEAAVFYALSLVAVGTMDDDATFAREKQAAAILNRILGENAEHPGVAHYLIHSFDYPPLAELALPAAQRYAGIAPDSAHAQHMPSHIFTRLGLWDESIRSNLKSAAASRAYAKAKGMPGAWEAQLHAMDYLAYAFLQIGQDAEADRVLAELNAIESVQPTTFTSAYAATAIPARLLLERRRWRDAAGLELHENVRGFLPLDKFKWGEAHILFARAVGAARSGQIAAARQELARLTAVEESLVVPPGTYDWKTQVGIERRIAEAWLAHAEGRKEESLKLMRAAADIDDATEKHPVTPGAILPAREQLGELLLELGQPAQALVEFEASLKRAPKRLAGLHGAANAARLAGDLDAARRHYEELVAMTRSAQGGRPEILHARSMMSELARR
jgi:tetratricopeptide (TPR) repeat protein